MSALLSMLPVLALVALLLLRRYPGERAMIALWSRRPRRARPGVVAPPRMRRGPLAAAVRGSLLMGRSLAVRPPPARAAAR